LLLHDGALSQRDWAGTCSVQAGEGQVLADRTSGGLLDFDLLGFRVRRFRDHDLQDAL
jgi:hypothetical protein